MTDISSNKTSAYISVHPLEPNDLTTVLLMYFSVYALYKVAVYFVIRA